MGFPSVFNLVLAVFLAVSTVAVKASDEALEHELDQLYQKQLAAEKLVQGQKAKGENVVVAPKATKEKKEVKLVIEKTKTQEPSEESLNFSDAPTTPEAAVFESKPSQVEAAPLSPSRADQMRKTRQEVEMQTEQAIVEQLESSRLDWERKRAEGVLKSMQNSQTQAQPAVQEQKSAAVVPATRTAEDQFLEEATAETQKVETQKVETKKEQKEDHSAELKQELKSIAADLKNSDENPKEEYYLSVGLGVPNYGNVGNLAYDLSWGVSLGTKFPSNVIFEGSVYYSLMRIERPTTVLVGLAPEMDNVEQYNGSAALKYAFLSGKVRPLVGALASYTHREYSCLQFFTCPPGRSRSNALDVGALVGGEVTVSNNFSVGVEYQVYRNVSYRLDSSIQQSFAFSRPWMGQLEDRDYSLFTVRGRWTF